jgi:hypothetical protein
VHNKRSKTTTVTVILTYALATLLTQCQQDGDGDIHCPAILAPET